MKILFVIFLLIYVLFCYGQNEYLRFHKIKSENGLSQNTGKDIQQDKYGFIWIATEGGLNRFDGRNIKIIRHDLDNANSLANDYINSIETGKSDNVYIGTDGSGLNIYNILTDSFRLISSRSYPEIKSDFIYSLYEDNINNIWIGTGNGLYKYNEKEKSLQTVLSPIEKEPLYIRSIISYNNKELIVATSNGLYSIDIKNNSSKLFEPNLKTVLTMQIIKNETLIAGGFEGISVFNLQELKKTDFNNISEYFSGKGISSIYKTHNEKAIWVGTNESGLYCVDILNNIINQYKPETQLSHSISSSNINSVFIDKENVLWVGTNYDGINFTDIGNIKFKTIIPNYNGQFISSISTICQTKDNNIWLGSTKGLFKYNIDKNELTKISTGNKNDLNFVTVLKEDSKGNVWAGTNDKGVFIFGKDRTTHFLPEKGNQNSIAGTSVWGLTEDEEGNMYMAVWGQGVSVYNPQKKQFSVLQHEENNTNSISTNNINAVLYNDGKLWIGTWDHGLDEYDVKNKIWKHHTHNSINNSGLSHNIVLSLAIDQKDKLWAGTYGGGINRYDPKDSSFKRFTIKEGLASNIVMGIQSDANNSLFVFTDGGLSKINLVNNKIRNYDFSDGLQSNDFSQNGIYKSHDGKILAAGAGGFNLFNPDSIIDNSSDPKLYMHEMYINNVLINPNDPNLFPRKPLLIADSILLSYKQNNITFSFSALDYTNQSKIRYSCKLENYEEDWVELGQNPWVRYTSIPPGNYTLKYRSTNKDGNWVANPNEFTIVITPPFWQRWWFILTAISVFILAIVLFIKLRERKLKAEKRILEAKIKERTFEISQQKEEIEAQRDEILAQRDLVTFQKEQIEHIHKEISQSIDYAKRLQSAILPEKDIIENYFAEHFILFKPKDKVSGDFYWWALVENKLIITVADCTGHGVPGAFMSMLGSSLLRDIIVKEYITHPSLILKRLRKEIIHMLKQKGVSGEQKDGMDMALIVINTDTLEAQFAGANNPIYIVRSQKSKVTAEIIEPDKLSDFGLDELKGDKMPISIHAKMDAFTTKDLQLNRGDCIYLFSDGFPDQFGGPSGRKFMYKKFKELILANAEKSMTEQNKILEETINNWIGNGKQIDDITVVGLRI